MKHETLSLVPVNHNVMYHIHLGQSCSQYTSKTKPISLTILVHKHRCLNIRCYINETDLNKTKVELFISAVHKTQ